MILLRFAQIKAPCQNNFLPLSLPNASSIWQMDKKANHHQGKAALFISLQKSEKTISEMGGGGTSIGDDLPSSLCPRTLQSMIWAYSTIRS